MGENSRESSGNVGLEQCKGVQESWADASEVELIWRVVDFVAGGVKGAGDGDGQSPDQ